MGNRDWLRSIQTRLQSPRRVHLNQAWLLPEREMARPGCGNSSPCTTVREEEKATESGARLCTGVFNIHFNPHNSI